MAHLHRRAQSLSSSLVADEWQEALARIAGVIFFSDGVVSEGASLGVNFVVPLKFYLSLLSL